MYFQAKAKKVNQASAAACFCCLLIFPAVCRCLLPVMRLSSGVCYLVLVFASVSSLLLLHTPFFCQLLLLAAVCCCLLPFAAVCL